MGPCPDQLHDVGVVQSHQQAHLKLKFLGNDRGWWTKTKEEKIGASARANIQHSTNRVNRTIAVRGIFIDNY